ncbi:MAG TPA: hypothetical protein VII97_06260 [Anaerolineales bacterium]
MSKRKIIILMAITLLCALLLAGNALAMSSANFRLGWFTPLTGGGGGHAGSANYAVNFTVGQTAIGKSASANYGVGLGYWYGIGALLKIYLPLILRN